MLDSFIQSFFTEWLDSFFNPQKRVYWLYILSALIIGFLYLYYLNKSYIFAFKKLFSSKIWWSKSSKVDYLIFFLNTILMSFLSSKLLTKSTIAFGVFYTLSDYKYGYSIFQGFFSNLQISIIFTLTLFITEDFSKYWVHRWLHTIPFLWPFHKVHHSATQLNFITVFRTHPIEAILFSIRNALIQGLIIGLFFFLFGEQINLFMILSANFFNFLFNILGSNLRHSPIALPYPDYIENYFLSPAQHHIHHSKAKKHYNKNYGVVFSCWDRWFGSFCHSEKKEVLTYGLINDKGDMEHKLSQIYLKPFFYSFKIFIKKLTSYKS